MAKALKRITVNPDSELGLLIKDAAALNERVLVDTGEAVYAIRIDPEIGDEIGPSGAVTGRLPSAEQVARSEAGIRAAAGSWKDVEIEEFKAYIAERRRASNRPSVEL